MTSAVTDRRYSCHLLHPALCPQLYASCLGRVNKTINNRLGRVVEWEHPSITLGVESYAPFLEPSDGIGCSEPLKWPDQLAFATRKSGRKLLWIKAGMRDVAPSAARHFDFGKEFRSFLKDCHFGVRHQLGAGYGRKESRRASADHNDLS
jgi:hypothetical protein